jgi:excinuclease ABC subunit C
MDDAERAGTGAPAAADAKLDALPPRPGVYLLKDRAGKVIYVGKAKNLRSRVRTYFRGGDERSQVRFLMSKLADVETLVTGNDKEALILENNLIKQYKPRYNIAPPPAERFVLAHSASPTGEGSV